MILFPISPSALSEWLNVTWELLSPSFMWNMPAQYKFLLDLNFTLFKEAHGAEP